LKRKKRRSGKPLEKQILRLPCRRSKARNTVALFAKPPLGELEVTISP